jgi:hypothetical protein
MNRLAHAERMGHMQRLLPGDLSRRPRDVGKVPDAHAEMWMTTHRPVLGGLPISAMRS